MELQKSDIYQDIGDFKNLTQLELIKKTQKWKRIFDDDIRSNDSYVQKKHLIKYAKNIKPELMFFVHKLPDEKGKMRPHKLVFIEFVKNYKKFFENLLDNATKYYLDVKDINTKQSKVNHDIYQNKEINCLCGGKYTLKNKAQHIKTRRHQDHIEQLENN